MKKPEVHHVETSNNVHSNVHHRPVAAAPVTMTTPVAAALSATDRTDGATHVPPVCLLMYISHSNDNWE